MNPNSHKRTVDAGETKQRSIKSSLGKKRKIVREVSPPRKKAKSDQYRAKELNFKGGLEGIKKLREKLLAKIKPIGESPKKQVSLTVKRSFKKAKKTSDLKKLARKKIVAKGKTSQLKKLARKKVDDRGKSSVFNKLVRNGGGETSASKLVRKKSDSGSIRTPMTPTSAGSGEQKPASTQRFVGKKRRVIGLTKKKVETNTKRSSSPKEATGTPKPQGRTKQRAVSRFPVVPKESNTPMSSKPNGSAGVGTRTVGMNPSQETKPLGNFKVRLGSRASMIRNIQSISSRAVRKPSSNISHPSLSTALSLGLLPPKPPLDPAHGKQNAAQPNLRSRQLQLPDTRKPPKPFALQRRSQETAGVSKVSNNLAGSTPLGSASAPLANASVKLVKKLSQPTEEKKKPSRSSTQTRLNRRRSKGKIPIQPRRLERKSVAKASDIVNKSAKARSKKPIPRKTKPKQNQTTVKTGQVARKLQLDVKSFMEQKVWLGHLHREFQKHISSNTKIVEKSYPYLENVEWILRRKQERYPDVRVEDPPKIVLK